MLGFGFGTGDAGVGNCVSESIGEEGRNVGKEGGKEREIPRRLRRPSFFSSTWKSSSRSCLEVTSQGPRLANVRYQTPLRLMHAYGMICPPSDGLCAAAAASSLSMLRPVM